MIVDGMGHIQAVCVDGLAARRVQTCHPDEFNVAFADPEILPLDHIGDEGDPEYAFWHPHPHSPYNARSIQIYVPQGLALPAASISRLRNYLELVKPFAVNLRMKRINQQAALLELLDEAHE